MNNNFKKNTIWNMIGTGINAFASLIFMIIVTRINGVYDAGTFTFAFTSATLFNIIGIYAGRIYQVTDTRKISNKEYIVNRTITCVIMMGMIIVFLAIKEYEKYKIITILLLGSLKMFEAFCEVIYGFFQRAELLYKVGISLTVKNIVGLIAFFIVDFYTKNMNLAIGCFILIYLLVMFIYDFRESDFKSKVKGKTDWGNVIYILKNGFPIFCQSFLNVYLINASKYAIDNIMTDNYQTIFGIIVMPATMMLLITQFMVHPFLNIITNYVKKNDYISLNKLLFKITLIIVAFGIISIILAYFIGIYILELIYGISLIEYNFSLSVILFGAIFSAITSVYLTALIAMRKNIVQMVGYIFVSLFAIFSSNYLVKKFEIMGASVNYAITMLICCLVFVCVYIFCSKKVSKGKKLLGK